MVMTVAAVASPRPYQTKAFAVPIHGLQRSDDGRVFLCLRRQVIHLRGKPLRIVAQLLELADDRLLVVEVPHGDRRP